MELIPAIAAIVVALAIAWSVPRAQTPQLLMAGLGSGALAWAIIVTVAAIRRLDELQQRIHLIAIAVSFATTDALVAMTLFFRALRLVTQQDAPVILRRGLPSGPSWRFRS